MARIHTNEDGTKSIVDTWGVADIESVAECDLDLETPLTPEQIEKVMNIIVEGYDANIGVNWEVIAMAIENVLQGESK